MANMILLGTRKGTVLFDRTGSSWNPRPIQHAGIPVCYAARDPRDGTLWASLDHGHWGPKLSRSRDGGGTWEDLSSLKYPEGARYIVKVLPTPDFDPTAPTGAPEYKDATVLKIWHLAFGHLPDPHAEWGHDPHFVSGCAGQPDHLWQQNHCGVFYSADGAQSWKKVSHPEAGVHFGFPIAVDANDGRCAWVVPARADMARMAIDGGLCVARTCDGGESWQVLRAGLPGADAYDIVLRHGLDVSGDCLCFGSTTGNVYVSEDRGETWQCLGNHFPPVYSVRFG